LALLPHYRRTDVLKALERASRFGAFSLAAVRRILAAQAQPKPLLDELADWHRATLDPLLRQDAIGPRPTSDYQHLLTPEESADETPTKEEPGDAADAADGAPGPREQILADFATWRVPLTAEQLDAALADAAQHNRSHLEFLQRLLAEQAGSRRQRRSERLIKEARFREALPLSTFNWNFNPAIPRLQIEALAQGDFIRRQQNVAFVGQAGLGKSRLIQSIGLAACMLELPVYSITSGELLEDLTAALADRTIHERVWFYAKFRLLSIDAFGFDRIERSLCPQAASWWYRSSTPAAKKAARPWSPTSTSNRGPNTWGTPRWPWRCSIASSTALPSSN